MMSFSKETCLKMLRDVNPSQAYIEGASAKILFWKKHAKQVVHYWDVVFRESPQDKKLNLVYVANDLLQKSRVSGRDFVDEFNKVLPTALKHLIKHSDIDVQQKIRRVVDVWRDREVFGRTAMRDFQALVSKISRTTPNKTTVSDEKLSQPSPVKPPAAHTALIGAAGQSHHLPVIM